MRWYRTEREEEKHTNTICVSQEGVYLEFDSLPGTVDNSYYPGFWSLTLGATYSRVYFPTKEERDAEVQFILKDAEIIDVPYID